MYPVLFTIKPFTVFSFQIGPISLYSYGLCVALAFLAGIWVAIKKAEHAQIEKDLILDLGLYLLISSIIGARLLYVLCNMSFYKLNPWKIFSLQEGGLAFFGGLILSTIVGSLFLRKRKVEILKIADIVAPSIALGLAIGRIGCFLYGCCYGKRTTLPWGIIFPINSPAGSAFPGMHIHPTQIYSSLNGLILLFLLTRIYQIKRFSGQVFCAFLLLYSITRGLLEFLRADQEILLLNLTLTQIFCIFLFVGAMIWYCILARSQQSTKETVR
ncbi:MAG: prolipoprotein diacylglyceryl transferase [bacterium]|nr:prolipoprotein diacylglyceryl transferase [bacterium]